MRNKKLLGILGLLAACGSGAAALAAPPSFAPIGEEEALLRATTSLAEAPRTDVDATVPFEAIFVTFRDGKTEVRHQRMARLYTEWAMDEMGDPRVSHDRSRQELVVHTSRTYLPGGKTVDTPENGFNDVTPDGIDRSVDHIDIREMVVTHTGLEPGAVIFLDWTVRDTVADPAPYDMLVFPNGRFPTGEMLVVAEGLRGETVNPENALYDLPEPQKDSRRLVWYMKDLGAAPRPMHGHEGDQLPWIALSSADGWESMIASTARSIEAASVERNGLAAVLADLEKDEPFLNDREMIAGWATMVGERTALLDYDSWRYLRSPRSAERALARSLATPMERSAILLACAREKEMGAALVFPARWRTTSRSVPALESLLHPLLRMADHDGETWWVDPVEGTVSSTPPFGHGVEYFVMEGREVTRERTPALTSRVEIAVFWDLVKGAARCEGRITGPCASRLGLENPEGLVRDWMSGWGDSTKVEEVRVFSSDPSRVVFQATAKAPIPAKDERGRIVVSLPTAPLSIDELVPRSSDLALGASEQMLFSEAPAEVTLRWHVRAPEEREVLSGRTVEVECPGGTLAVQRNGQGKEIELTYTLVWDGRAVRPETYGEFRAFSLEALDERNTRIILGSKEKKEES